MKIDPSGRSDGPARVAPNTAEGTGPRKRWLRPVLVACALVVLAVAGFGARHAIFGLLLTRSLGIATGDRVSIDQFHIGQARSVFTGVRVTTPAGDPVLAAERVTLRVSLSALLSDRVHRFGILGIDVDRPIVSIVRRPDGSYNIGRGAGGSAGASGGGSAVPWNLSVRLRDGEIRLIDRAPNAADLGQQHIVGLNLDAALHSDGRSTASGGAQYVARRNETAPLRRWPFRLGALVDNSRGVAIVRFEAPVLPVRGPIAYVQHSAAVRIDDGVLRQVAIHVFALDVGAGRPVDVHIGGVGDLSEGRLTIAALRQPVRDLRGRIFLTDDGVWSTRLDGSLAKLPFVARGGGFDRMHPTLRLGVNATGDLRDLRTAFGFSQSQPVRGRVRVQTLLEAPTANLLIRSFLQIRRGAYRDAPLRDVSGRVDYHAGAVLLDGVRGRYGASAVGVGGRFLLGGPALDSAVVATASAPARSIPYAENLAPEAAVDALTLITGGLDGYRARGALALSGRGIGGAGMFAIDERGVGEFGPFRLRRDDGSSVIGALRLERPQSQSAAWISARGYRVAVPRRPSRLAGLNVPAFPPVAGVLDADLAGGGTPQTFALTGSARGRDLRVGTVRLGAGRAELGGSFRDLRLAGLSMAGPVGRFTGSGAAGAGAFALRGEYEGSLDRLVPLTGRQQAHGAVHGHVLATFGDGGVVVQSPDAALKRATVRGVRLDAAAGTIAVRNDVFHLLAATASIGGRHAVAAESRGTVAVSAPDIPSAALRGTGVPLDAGVVSTFGAAVLGGAFTRFDGTIAIAGGRARGYGVAGDARIRLVGPHAQIVAATAALGGTYGTLGGTIDGIGNGSLHYDLDARVPLGDIDRLRGDLAIPVRHLAGTFGAKLHVHGAGTRPFVDGRIDAPEGTYNGLAFRDAGARIVLDADGVAARDAALRVGSTRASFAASTSRGAFGISVRSGAVDLADFDDFFDASETLAGRGSLALSLQTYGNRIVSAGDFDVTGLRYRDFRLGQTRAHWETHGRQIAGSGRIRSGAGSLEAAAAIVPGAGSPRAAFGMARYDARADFRQIDLGTWVPAVTPRAPPILGKLDARLSARGVLPRLALTVDAAVADATVNGFAVASAHLRAASRGSRITVTRSDADLGFAQLTASGNLGLEKNDPLGFDLRASTTDIGRAARTFLPAARGVDLGGALDADVRISGTRSAPRIAGGFDVRDARYKGFLVPRAIGELALAGPAIEVRDADVELTRGQAFVAGSLPLLLRPFGLGPPRAPLSFDVTARGVDLAQFAPLLPAGTNIGGTIDGRFGVEGTLDRPTLFGSLELTGGSYASPFERAPIEHAGATVTFARSSVALESVHADVGGGTLDGSGRITLPLGDRTGIRYRGDLTAHLARLDFPAYGRGTLDGKVELSGAGAQPLVSGQIDVRDAIIPVSAVYRGGAPSGGVQAGSPPIDPAFRIHAAAVRNVRIRSALADIGIAGSVDLTGTLSAPQLAGAFTATDGTISSYNHIFRIVNASVTFDPADGATPTIAARAISRVNNPDPDPSRNIAGSANIIVTVSGTPDSNNLQVTYTSDPAYSQEQIIGLLLDVPALLGAVNFNLNGGPGTPLLRGAPGETNALLPPGVTPEQVSAISFNQEVFSLLNGQFTQRALTPVERVFEKTLGLSDVEFTVDYGGGIGYSLRRQIGKRDFYAFLSQTVSYPERANVGFELQPKPFENINFSYYQQNGITSLITNETPGEFLGSTRRLTSVQPLGNRSGFSLDLSRRF
jgi:hypothetical protein